VSIPVEQSSHENVLDIVSPRVGIIRSLRPMSTELVELAPIQLFEAELADFAFSGNDGKKTRLGVGKGVTEQAAMMGAIGESIERYCAMQPDYDSIVDASADELGAAALPPPAFVLYAEAQYENGEVPYRPFRSGARTAWVRGQSLSDGREMFVPASMAYLGYVGEQLCHNTSNGLAAGSSLDAAVLGGLCELIERDAFLIAWMNKLPVPEVLFGETHAAAHAIRMHYRGLGVEIRVFDVTTDIPVHVMMAFAIDRSGHGPSAVVGLGCSLDPEDAVMKALLELCQGRVSETWRYRQRKPGERILSVEDVRQLEDHGAVYAEPYMLKELDFLFATSRKTMLDQLPNLSRGDVEADLGRCVELLGKAGSRAAFVDLTTPDVAPFGLHVVRAVATKLQPIHFGYRRERLGGERVFDVPRILGYADRTRTIGDLNRCPHPLP